MVTMWEELQKIYEGKHVFVTGHTGFKGAWLCILLKQLGARITGYALDPPTRPSLYEITLGKGVIEKSEIADIRNYNTLLEALNNANPDIVIHMAAQPLVRESYKNPVDTYAINVMGTVHLLEALRHNKSVRAVLNVTTDKCYENKEWLWGYRENEPMGGYDPYSNSKACSELVTSSYRQSYFNPDNYGKTHQILVATARAGNVIGGGDWAEDRLIPDFMRAIMNKEKVNIRSPHAIRPWQHVLEPLFGYLLLSAKLYQGNIDYVGGWNFGPDSADAKNVEWIIHQICSLWGDGADYSIDKTSQPHEANYLKLECSKANTSLQWHPKWNVSIALEKIVEWNKAYVSGYDMLEVCISQINDYFSKSL